MKSFQSLESFKTWFYGRHPEDGVKILVTPEIAKFLFETRSEFQRKVKRKNVAFLKRQLLENKWRYNGETIGISENYTLVDGQHFCVAVMESGIAGERLLAFNVPEDSIHTINTGTNRSPADVIYMRGTRNKYYLTIASAASLVVEFNKGKYSGKGGGREGSDNSDILGFIESNPEFEAFVGNAMTMRSEGDGIVAPKLFCGAYWLIEQISDVSAKEFFKQLATGIDCGKKDAVYGLRRRLIKQKLGTDRKFSFAEKLRGIIHAWNCYVANRELSYFRLPESMPKIKKPKANAVV